LAAVLVLHRALSLRAGACARMVAPAVVVPPASFFDLPPLPAVALGPDAMDSAGPTQSVWPGDMRAAVRSLRKSAAASAPLACVLVRAFAGVDCACG
jgi:hypothetical protein